MKRRRKPPTPDERCGKYSGWQAHQDRGEMPCEPCRKACNEWMTEYRNRNPSYRQKQSMRSKCRQRARARLARMYPADYNRLYYAELDRERRGDELEDDGSSSQRRRT